MTPSLSLGSWLTVLKLRQDQLSADSTVGLPRPSDIDCTQRLCNWQLLHSCTLRSRLLRERTHYATSTLKNYSNALSALVHWWRYHDKILILPFSHSLSSSDVRIKGRRWQSIWISTSFQRCSKKAIKGRSPAGQWAHEGKKKNIYIVLCKAEDL